MQGDLVRLLHRRGQRGRGARVTHADLLVASGGKRVRRRTGQRPGGQLPLAGRAPCARHVGLRPAVDIASSTSPGLPCAATWRAKTSSYPKSLAIAVTAEVSACSAM